MDADRLVPRLRQRPLQEEAADPAMDLYYAANASYNRKLYPIAASQYEDFLKRYGNHESTQARYGWRWLFALKQADKALPHFQHLLDTKNLDQTMDRGQLTLLHAQCLISTGKDDEALNRLTDAADKLRISSACWSHCGGVDLHYAKGQWEETVQWATKLGKLGRTRGSQSGGVPAGHGSVGEKHPRRSRCSAHRDGL